MGLLSAYIRPIVVIMLAVKFTCWFTIFPPLLVLGFVRLLLSPYTFPLALAYIIWCVVDRDTPYQGGRRWEKLRNSFVWGWLASYFPLSLHKTAELDPSKCYILAHHPHAVIGVSNCGNFGTDGTDARAKFPGITFHPLTLNFNFWIPLMRDLAIWHGFAAVSARSIVHKMTKLEPGHAVSIVVGGAAEAGLTDPDDPYQLKLKDRKGFVKMAFKTGASIVPVFSFGEANIFTVIRTAPGSLLWKFQDFIRRHFTFWPIIFYGHCILLPYRHPIHTVVGAPIEVPLKENPTTDEVDDIHSVYIKALEKLFNDNVGKYGDPSKKLKIL